MSKEIVGHLKYTEEHPRIGDYVVYVLSKDRELPVLDENSLEGWWAEFFNQEIDIWELEQPERLTGMVAIMYDAIQATNPNEVWHAYKLTVQSKLRGPDVEYVFCTWLYEHNYPQIYVEVQRTRKLIKHRSIPLTKEMIDGWIAKLKATPKSP